MPQVENSWSLASNRRVSPRVVVPEWPTVHAYVKVRSSLSHAYGGLVRDISTSGVAIRLNQIPWEILKEGENVTVVLSHESANATINGRLVRVLGRDLSIRLEVEEEVHPFSLSLLSLLVLVAVRSIVLVDLAQCPGLKHRPLVRHYYCGSYFDLRVQNEPEAWWQLVFLEYLIEWRVSMGIRTAQLERTMPNATEATVGPRSLVNRRILVAPALEVIAIKLMRHVQDLLPEGREDFRFVLGTLSRSV